MKILVTFTMLLCTTAVFAHSGPEAMQQHSLEHLWIGLALIIPVGYALAKLFKGSR